MKTEELEAAMTHNRANASKLCANRRDDLESAGNEAIGLALSRFDPNRGFKFLTFASAYIEKAQRMEKKNSRSPVRIPWNASAFFESVPVEDILNLAEDQPEPPDSRVEVVLAGLARLSKRDRAVIRLHFMEGKTLKQIARRQKISTAGAALRVTSALKRLRDAVKNAQN